MRCFLNDSHRKLLPGVQSSPTPYADNAHITTKPRLELPARPVANGASELLGLTHGRNGPAAREKCFTPHGVTALECPFLQRAL